MTKSILTVIAATTAAGLAVSIGLAWLMARGGDTGRLVVGVLLLAIVIAAMLWFQCDEILC